MKHLARRPTSLPILSALLISATALPSCMALFKPKPKIVGADGRVVFDAADRDLSGRSPGEPFYCNAFVSNDQMTRASCFGTQEDCGANVKALQAEGMAVSGCRAASNVHCATAYPQGASMPTTMCLPTPQECEEWRAFQMSEWKVKDLDISACVTLDQAWTPPTSAKTATR